jgi:hypothetical protein
MSKSQNDKCHYSSSSSSSSVAIWLWQCGIFVYQMSKPLQDESFKDFFFLNNYYL